MKWWTRRIENWEATLEAEHDVEEILRALSSLCAALFLIITFSLSVLMLLWKRALQRKMRSRVGPFNFLCWVWELILILIYNWDERCFYILSLCSLCFRHPVLFAFYSFFSPLSFKLRLHTTLRRVTELSQ